MIKISPPRRQLARVLFLALLSALLLVGIAVYSGTPGGELMPEAPAALISDPAGAVNHERWILFIP